MRRSSFFLTLIFLAYMVSCAAPQLTPEDQAYIERALACPLIFTVPEEKIDEAWSRTHAWIAQYSSMKIQIATDYVVQTFNPPGMEFTFVPKYGYSVTRTKLSNTYQIIVQCLYAGDFGQTPAVNQNAHILAYYIKSNELRPHLIYK